MLGLCVAGCGGPTRTCFFLERRCNLVKAHDHPGVRCVMRRGARFHSHSCGPQHIHYLYSPRPQFMTCPTKYLHLSSLPSHLSSPVVSNQVSPFPIRYLNLSSPLLPPRKYYSCSIVGIIAVRSTQRTSTQRVAHNAQLTARSPQRTAH